MICDNISLMVNEMCVFVLLYFLECSKVLGINMCFFQRLVPFVPNTSVSLLLAVTLLLPSMKVSTLFL